MVPQAALIGFSGSASTSCRRRRILPASGILVQTTSESAPSCTMIRHQFHGPPVGIVSARALAVHGTLNMIELRCEGGTAMPTSESSRRALIKAMGVAAAAATCSRATSAKAEDYKPQDQKKLTPAAARYQDRPKENENC